VVELEQAAEALLTFNGAGTGGLSRAKEDHVFLALVRALAVVVLDEVIERALQGWFAEENELIEALLLD